MNFSAASRVAALLLLGWAAATAQIGYEAIDLDHPAIGYRRQPASDPVARLNERFDRGEARLQFERGVGYLRSVLQHLGVPVESQMAVFSKTSLQGALIEPSNPRTVFFNDAVAVAWMRGGFIEVAAHDPVRGPRFYVLPQREVAAPRFEREQGSECLRCHYSASAGGVPALFARSIPTSADGLPMQWLGNATPDHRTPIAERWGGWYVTGSPGPLRHLGNLKIADARAQELPPWNAARTLTTLAGQFDTGGYLSAHSDIVALLVFDHQARMMNLLTRVGWIARIEAHDRTPAAATRLRAEVEELVDYMLFVGEAPLDNVRGTSGYAERFAAMGPRDSKGRSLRDLDLKTRLLRYRCSYMIYSEAFEALPTDARDLVYQRLKEKLTGADGAVVLEILRETKKNLPAGF